MKKIAIAIDGPAGAGKSTIAKIIADRLNILYVDTGAMYRAVTLGIIHNNIELSDSEAISNLLKNMDITLNRSRVYLNNADVSEDIRGQEVNNLVSPVSAIPIVRQKLIELQRNMASKDSVIMDGRDIGTNVLKNADVKIFLTASGDERAQRRYQEMIAKGYSIDLDTVKLGIISRDKIDSERAINPLRKADDAIVVDTTEKSVEAVVEEIISIIKER